MGNTKELGPNVTRHDVLSFVENVGKTAIKAIKAENSLEALALQRELFMDETTMKLIADLSQYSKKVKLLTSKLQANVNRNHDEQKVKYGGNLYVLHDSETSIEHLEEIYLNLFSHPQLRALREKHDKKLMETRNAYRVILHTLKCMRSTKKMSEYLLSVGFDISKIEAREPVVSKKEEPKPTFTKEVLFPCLKD